MIGMHVQPNFRSICHKASTHKPQNAGIKGGQCIRNFAAGASELVTIHETRKRVLHITVP